MIYQPELSAPLIPTHDRRKYRCAAVCNQPITDTMTTLHIGYNNYYVHPKCAQLVLEAHQLAAEIRALGWPHYTTTKRSAA